MSGIDSKDLQSENKLPISASLSVLHFEMSGIDF